MISASVVAGCVPSTDEAPRDQPAAEGTELIAEGKEYYEETCAACHGEDLRGTGTGPPFLSPIYAPDHHADESFYLAVENGAQPHHWDFGPMPPQPSVTEEEVTAIIAYVRAQQAEAGITEDTDHP